MAPLHREPAASLPRSVHPEPESAAVAQVAQGAPGHPPDRRRVLVAVAAGVTALLLVAALFFPSPSRTASSPMSLSSSAIDDGGTVGTVVINPGVQAEAAALSPESGDRLVQQVLTPPPSPAQDPPPGPRPAPAAPGLPSPMGHRDPLTAPRPAVGRPRPVRVAPAAPERAGQPWTPSEIFQVMRPHLPALRQCFAGAGGNLQMLFDVDEGGRMASPRIVSLPPSDPRWRCVLGVTRQVRFGAGRPGQALTFFQSYSN